MPKVPKKRELRVELTRCEDLIIKPVAKKAITKKATAKKQAFAVTDPREEKVPCPVCLKYYKKTYIAEHRRLRHGWAYKNDSIGKRAAEAAVGFGIPENLEVFKNNLRKMYERLDKKNDEHQDFMVELAADIVDVLFRKNLKALKAKINDRLKVAQDPEETTVNDDEGSASIRADLEQTLVLPGNGIKLSDVVGMEVCKQTVKEIASLPILYPQFFYGSWKPWSGILLYGPPGNGKTFLAKAVANDLNLPFFSISTSNIESMWRGRSQRIVRELFKMASEKKPSVVFLDEVDAMCPRRDVNSSQCSIGVVSEFLTQTDGVGSHEGVLVLAATNKPWMLDSAIRRRLDKRYFIGLPDKHSRSKLIEGLLSREENNLTSKHLRKVAKRTEGFSNSDLRYLFNAAKTIQARECDKAEYFKPCVFRVFGQDGVVTVYEGFWKPCEEGEIGAKAMRMSDCPPKISLGELTMNHFKEALLDAGPSTKTSELRQYDQFTEDFAHET